MKIFLVLILALVLAFNSPPAFSQTAPEPQEEFFSAAGEITEVSQEDKILRVKITGGLELTFRADEATVIKAGETVKAFADLAPEDSVQLSYRYNDDYEKVARTVTIVPEKSEGPAA